MNLALFSFSFSGNSPFFPRKTSILLCGYCPQTSFATETLELGNIMWVLQVRQTSFLANKHLHFLMKSHRALYLHKVLLNNVVNDNIDNPAYATCNFRQRVNLALQFSIHGCIHGCRRNLHLPMLQSFTQDYRFRRKQAHMASSSLSLLPYFEIQISQTI